MEEEGRFSSDSFAPEAVSLPSSPPPIDGLPPTQSIRPWTTGGVSGEGPGDPTVLPTHCGSPPIGTLSPLNGVREVFTGGKTGLQRWNPVLEPPALRLSPGHLEATLRSLHPSPMTDWAHTHFCGLKSGLDSLKLGLEGLPLPTLDATASVVGGTWAMVLTLWMFRWGGGAPRRAATAAAAANNHTDAGRPVPSTTADFPVLSVEMSGTAQLVELRRTSQRQTLQLQQMNRHFTDHQQRLNMLNQLYRSGSTRPSPAG